MSARECPDCGATGSDLHHCVWDGLVCLVCGWEENPL
jgi:hypothetical protein